MPVNMKTSNGQYDTGSMSMSSFIAMYTHIQPKTFNNVQDFSK